MKVAAIQMVSTPDPVHNAERARYWLHEAAAQGVQLAALPEYFCLMGQQDSDKLAIAETAADTTAPLQRMLSETAAALGLWLIGGTLPLRAATPERVRNATCVYAPDGHLAARYDKIHLFRFDNGRESYDEARVLEAGEQPCTFVAPISATAEHAAFDLKVGLSVCYDLRFPELYRAMSFSGDQVPCDLFAVPAAFTYTTGQAHWELLLRARAIENQAFVIAPAQGGLHQNGRRTWGHSMIVDPWGDVLACLPEGEGLAVATLDMARLRAVRQQLPALQHRRL
ncbi:carbon-nitrogen hydrolase family protein [Roseateles koreensis]|uniref:Carbon-nitrogen hydrolase family protein n=1 Tax=Roseateles koreensis TaxID=2987526 RepID=A0ABT5KW90_9BURK|nr:carbon-nitrogen hydrolase family protein [Roseateles koreensis]MDC8787218.1 carbon-nitrogen hydrolase family protein [Roseateles koreensis]